MARNATAYDEDFFAWTTEQARLLRAGQWGSIDAENLAEEIEGLGRSVRRELENRLIALIAQLLRWRHQPGFRSESWSLQFVEQRRQVGKLFDESPSLRSEAPEMLSFAFEIGRLRAVAQTGLADDAFPEECPFSCEQILSPEFLPD